MVAATARVATPPRLHDLTDSQRARRQRIVDQAFALLLQREYDEIQMRDVAEAADVALGTVYRYFASKEHLFAAALVKWGDALRQRVAAAPAPVGDVAGEVAAVYRRAVEAFHRRPQFFRALVAIESTRDVHARELRAEFQVVSSAAFDEPLRSLDGDVARAVSDTLLYVLHGALRSWANGSISIEDVHRRVMNAIGLVFGPPP